MLLCSANPRKHTLVSYPQIGTHLVWSFSSKNWLSVVCFNGGWCTGLPLAYSCKGMTQGSLMDFPVNVPYLLWQGDNLSGILTLSSWHLMNKSKNWCRLTQSDCARAFATTTSAQSSALSTRRLLQDMALTGLTPWQGHCGMSQNWCYGMHCLIS